MQTLFTYQVHYSILIIMLRGLDSYLKSSRNYEEQKDLHWVNGWNYRLGMAE